MDSAKLGERESSVENDAATQVRSLWRRLGEATIAEIIGSYESGSSVKQLAAAHSVSSDGMLRLLKQRGVRMRRQPPSPEQRSETIR